MWCAGMLLTTIAVDRGGNATVMPLFNALTLVTAGGWGVLWYGEIRGRAVIGWCAAAAFTMVSVVLLGLEKV